MRYWWLRVAVIDQLVATYLYINYNLMSRLSGKVTSRDRRIDEQTSQKLFCVHFKSI